MQVPKDIKVLSNQLNSFKIFNSYWQTMVNDLCSYIHKVCSDVYILSQVDFLNLEDQTFRREFDIFLLKITCTVLSLVGKDLLYPVRTNFI